MKIVSEILEARNGMGRTGERQKLLAHYVYIFCTFFKERKNIKMNNHVNDLGLYHIKSGTTHLYTLTAYSITTIFTPPTGNIS
jgi:hypothetical protein